jgi:LysM repeat protein
LSRHRKPSRIRLPQAATAAAAAPTLAGVATAFCLSPQAALASTTPPAPATQAATHHVTVPAAYQRPPSPARLLAARQATAHKTAAALPSWYTVRSGDSLSVIAGRFYHDAAAWPVIYWGNHSQIRWADLIQTGQRLRIPAKPAHIPSPPAALAPLVYAPRHAARAPSPAQGEAPAPAQRTRAASVTATWSGTYPGGAFGACVVARESGGNPQVMNSTGHYGLYQFSASTWAEYGGNPADFGHASVAEQNRVFANALAAGGRYNWSPYDGC